MKTTIATAVISLMSISSVEAQNKLNADISKTTLEWLGEKVLGKHTGTIKLKSGHLEWRDNRIISGEFVIDMKTIRDDDSNARLEGHLKSDDFFGVEKFPESRIVITGSTPFDNGTGTVKGNLTIKGITHPVEFMSAVQKSDEGVWFYANITIDRSRYNVRYGSGKFFSNLGNQLIYDEFKVKVSLLVK